MVLILSERGDISTLKVVDWLLFYGIDYKIIQREDEIKNIFFFINSKSLSNGVTIKEDKIDLKLVDSVWYRRGDLNIQFPATDNILLPFFVNKHLDSEWRSVSEYIFRELEQLPSLGSYFSNKYSSKIINLKVACKCGLNIPKTWVLSSKKELLEIMQTHEKLITKSILYDLSAQVGQQRYYNTFGPTYITDEIVENLDQFFFPSLIQEYIEKSFEVRVFVLGEKLYPMAICSQANNSTLMDYRADSSNKSVRMIPFLLPNIVKKKLLQFLKKSKMDTGSIDLIVSPKNEFYFLEINPVGQFDFLNGYCTVNYGFFMF